MEVPWRDRGVVSFLKVDKGLEAERDGARVMKPISARDALLARAAKLGVFGTKRRSAINLPSEHGIAAVVAQQFEIARHIAGRGFISIIEPEILITSPGKAAAEGILQSELTKRLEAFPNGIKVMLKLTIPDEPDFYLALTNHQRGARVVAPSGGYTRAEACRRLAANHGMIASFSRALLEHVALSTDEVLARMR